MILKIRSADWRDHEAVQAVRAFAMTELSLDGGLYELLHWPIFHCHVAVQDGQVIGVAALFLPPGPIADSQGVAVRPEHRGKRIASHLRAAQARDLQLLGYETLDVALPSENEAAMAMTLRHFPLELSPILVDGQKPYRYFRVPVKDLLQRASTEVGRYPHPLTPAQETMLQRKGEKARAMHQTLLLIDVLSREKSQRRYGG